MLILFKHHPNRTRTHRTPSRANKGTSPIVPRNTPLFEITNQRTPICLAPTYANPTTAPTTPPNTRNFKKDTPRDIHLPRILISKTKDSSSNATNTAPITKNSHDISKRFAPSYAKSKTTPTGQQKQSLSRTRVPTVCPYSPFPQEPKKGRLLKCSKTALPSKRGKYQKYNKTPPATKEYRSDWKAYKYK